MIFAATNTLLSAQQKQPYDHWLDNYEQGVNNFNQSLFNEAIPFFEKAKTYLDKIDFKSDEATQIYPVYNYDYLALCYFKNNDFENAAENYLAALNILRTLENAEKAYAKQLLNDLAFSYARFAPDKALELLNEVLGKMKASGNEKNTDYTELLFTLFQIHKSQNNVSGMIQSLEEACRIHEDINSVNHQQYPIIVFNLAYILYQQADYYNALIYFKKTDALLDFYKTQDWINIGKLNYDYGLCYFKENSFDKAEEKFRDVINDPWFLSPENAELNLYANNYLGLSLYYLDKTDEAIQVYTNDITHLENVLDASNPLLALQKTNLTRIFIYIEDYKRALPLSNEVYETMQNTQQTDSQAYINAVNNLGLLYMYNSEFTKAEDFLKKALAITENSYDANPIHIADIKSNLAYVNQQISNFREAKIYHKETLEIKQQYLYPLSPEYAKALQNYGTFLFETGEHLKAEDYFLSALEIFEKNNDTSSLLYAGLMQNLGQLYYTTSRIKESLSNYEAAIEIYREKGIENSETLANALNGKAKCLIALGDNKTALNIGKQAFDLIETNFEKESLQYGDALFTYGSILRSNYNFDEADLYFAKANKIFDKYPNYNIERKIDLVEIYIVDLVANRNFDEAFKILEAIEEYYITTYGFESFNYSRVLQQKAQIATYAGDLEYAIRLYESVTTVFKKTITVNSEDYSNMLFNYATTLDQANRTIEAINQYQNYDKGKQDVLKDVFTYRSEEDKKKFLKELQYKTDRINFNIFKRDSLYKDLIGIGINNQLMLKSLLLNTSKDVISKLSKSKNSLVIEKVDRYGTIKFQLSNPLVLNNKERSSELRSELNTLETELVKIYDEQFGNSQNENFNRDWTKIKEALQPNEVAIEFIEFETSSDNLLSPQRAYGAYIITPNSELPKVVNLCSLDDLKTVLKNKNPNVLYQTRGSKAKSTSNTKGLYELLWSPLESYLSGTETIYFSPAGLLNQIPFAALDTEDQPILASQYNLIQLGSTFSITEPKKKTKSDQTIFFGGIDYEFEGNSTLTKKETSVSDLVALQSLTGTRSMGNKWTYLPGTLSEVNTIKGLFSKANKKFNSLIGTDATEGSFKNMSGKSPNIIHIATHGFFFENPKSNATSSSTYKNVYRISEDPLLRSGLVFSGANYAWLNGANPFQEEDGILTSLEISNLNLSNTDLVVLSACETGLGDIDGSEGVYGLQRAFKMAGVDLIMMSLWEVPDKETAEFMELFYSNWLSGQNIREAFRNTQLDMFNTYKANPEKWAAFVLVE